MGFDLKLAPLDFFLQFPLGHWAGLGFKGCPRPARLAQLF
jgi:hypothetical protein